MKIASEQILLNTLNGKNTEFYPELRKAFERYNWKTFPNPKLKEYAKASYDCKWMEEYDKLCWDVSYGRISEAEQNLRYEELKGLEL